MDKDVMSFMGHAVPLRLGMSASTVGATELRGKLRPGSRVQIGGMEKDLDQNGMGAWVVEYNPASERWRVLLDDGRRREILPDHLMVLEFPFGAAVPNRLDDFPLADCVDHVLVGSDTRRLKRFGRDL